MENKCKIVVDLLPTYIEKMTSNETNKFIEEHLRNCKNCNQIYLNMIEEIKKEDISNDEIVHTIKKYKNKIFLIKFFVITILLVVIGINLTNLGFKYFVLSNAYKKNIKYDIGKNYTIEEYNENIERYEFHTTTYFGYGKMKKIYGDQLLEYYDGKNHYYFNNTDMTYYVEENVKLDDDININLETFKNINSNFELIKLLVSKEIVISQKNLRDEMYYLIKNSLGERIYLDKETFFAEAILKPNISDDKEYRITQSNVNWRLVEMPDISAYTQVSK